MTRNKPVRVDSPLTEKKKRVLLELDSFTPPAVGIQDAPNRCYRLNNEWAKIIMGFASLLTETRGWDGATDESHPGIQGVSQFLIGEECDMLDCLDVEDCLDISSIIVALAAVSYSGLLAGTQAHFDDLNALYDGTAQSVGPSIPLTPPADDTLDNNALCYVLRQFVRGYANTKAVRLIEMGDIQRSVQGIISALREVFVIVPQFLWWLLGDELYGCVANPEQALNALGDTEWMSEVACCLYSEMRDTPITRASWDAAIASCAASLSTGPAVIACLMDGDNNLNHYLSFLEAYNTVLVRQAAGEDFSCFCAPAGWFWLSVPWEHDFPTHSGSAVSPVFTHTNPSNGELFSITARFQGLPPDKNGIRPTDTGLSDALLVGSPTRVGSGLWLWEHEFVGVMEGADAVDWPLAWRKDTGMNTALRQPDQTFSIKWTHEVDLGHSRAGKVGRVLLLYKEVP